MLGPGFFFINTAKRKSLTNRPSFFFWILFFIGVGVIFFLYLWENHTRKIIKDEEMIKNYGIFYNYVPRIYYLVS